MPGNCPAWLRPSAARLWKTFRSKPQRNTVRIHNGMVFAFPPERCSPSQRNRVRLRPDSPTGVRAGEIGALPLRNLRLEQGAIKITQSVWHGKIQTVKSLKGKPALRNLSSTGRAPAAVRPPVATESTRSSLRDEKRYAMGYRRSAQKKTVPAA